jgi:hypothetical protein
MYKPSGSIVNFHINHICVLLFLAASVYNTDAIEKREPFQVPLAILTVHLNQKTGNLDEVFISYGSKTEGWAISSLNDRHIKFTLKRQVDHIYKENPRIAYMLTDFEAKHLNRVCNTLVRTLTMYERFLQRKEWGKLLYLDGYLPSFFKGFHYLMLASYCYRVQMPAFTCIPDSLFDNSFNSIKSDRRIRLWRSKPDRVIKLRIITKEVIHQIKLWQKKELNNQNRDPRDSHSKQFKHMYELLIRLYFNMMQI